MTWTDTQVALLRALAAYDRADRASKLVGDMIEGQWRKADQLHTELLKAALGCGFEPGGRHRHLTTVQFAEQRGATIARLLGPYVQEAGI